MRIVHAVITVLLLSLTANAQRSVQQSVVQMLTEMAENYRQKVDDRTSMKVQINIQPTAEIWYVIVEPNRKVTVSQDSNGPAQFIFTTTESTLRKIYRGEMTALTAAAQAKSSDPTPLKLEFGPGVAFDHATRIKLFDFLQHFFNRTSPEKVLFGERHSRVVHGAHAVPLYYHPGLRSAWYMIKKGERLNGPGDVNPFPQAFIFISGEGFARIGGKTIKVKGGEACYIPPNSEHYVWNSKKRPLVLIFLAWGDGA